MDEFKELPTNLRTKLTMELNRNVLLKCPLWEMLPWDVVIALMSQLRPKVFLPDQDILQQGKPSAGLHFIEQGKVKVVQRATDNQSRATQSRMTMGQGQKKDGWVVLRTMGNAQFFGESSLLHILRETIARFEEEEGLPPSDNTRAPRRATDYDGMATATVRSVGFCDILMLSNVAFEKVLNTHEAMRASIVDVQTALATNKIDGMSGRLAKRTTPTLLKYTKASDSCSQRERQTSVERATREESSKAIISETCVKATMAASSLLRRKRSSGDKLRRTSAECNLTAEGDTIRSTSLEMVG
eukprot:3631867-Prymnesium_polylepis.2